MDIHPSRELVGSGQRGGKDRKSQPHVRIWSTESLQTLYVFGMGELDTGVIAVAFSQLNGGSYILAVDAGRESILSVWQWQWGHLLGKVAVSMIVQVLSIYVCGKRKETLFKSICWNRRTFLMETFRHNTLNLTSLSFSV